MATEATTTRTEARARLIHREIVQLLQLGVLAIAAFFVTRALATSNRRTTLQNGAEWYARGTALMNRGAFRRATVTNRHEPKYVLAMAGAMARQHQTAAARAALLTLRESMPESPDVNLQLARIAAERQDVTEAVAYYHNTVYAPWPADAGSGRRRVRLELADFLLAHGQPGNAVSELNALGTDMPDEAPAHVALAARFARAGDHRNALAQFEAALRRGPRDNEVLAGAGDAAFALGDYPLARRYYRSIPDPAPPVAANRDMVDLILANDPLAPRLGAAERRRRLAGDLVYAQNRLDECSARSAGRPAAGDAPDVERRARLLNTRLRSATGTDMDTIEDGMELVSEMVRSASQHCAPASLHDRALLAIASRHAADTR
jgi:tetratricopeptide (TPR) repeat protein